MDDIPIQVGVHKEALQNRSRKKLALTLEVTRGLLEEGGPQAVSTTAVAARAGISVGWLYNYFENRDALLEEILVGCLRGLDGAMADAGMDLSGPDWRPKAEAGAQACLDYFSKDASFRAIWFSGEFSGRMIQVNRLHDDALAAWLAGTVTQMRPDAPKVSISTVMEISWGCSTREWTWPSGTARSTAIRKFLTKFDARAWNIWRHIFHSRKPRWHKRTQASRRSAS